MKCSALAERPPLVEVCPLDRAREAYDRIVAAETHFRAVLKISG